MKKQLIYFTLIGLVIGSAAGYLYYHYVGCAGGTCAITSRPVPSTLYGAMMGGLLMNSIADYVRGRRRTKTRDEQNSNT